MSGVSLADRKGYLTLLLSLNKEDNMVLRRAENIREWHDLILRLVTEVGTRDRRCLDNDILTSGSCKDDAERGEFLEEDSSGGIRADDGARLVSDEKDPVIRRQRSSS